MIHLVRELGATRDNVERIRAIGRLTKADYRAIDEKIGILQSYRDAVTTQNERDQIDTTILALFLARRGQLAEAGRALLGLGDRFERERAQRALLGCLPLGLRMLR